MATKRPATPELTRGQRFVCELITFPGYAGVLFGWLAFIGLAVFSVAVKLGLDKQPLVVEQSSAPSSSGETVPAVVAAIIGILVVVALLAAVWVYVARWTKAGVVWLAKLLRVKPESYWSFCTGVLIVGWLLLEGVVLLVGNAEFIIGSAFVGAAWILVGGGSFGLAALRRIASPLGDTRAQKAKTKKA